MLNYKCVVTQISRIKYDLSNEFFSVKMLPANKIWGKTKNTENAFQTSVFKKSENNFVQ